MAKAQTFAWDQGVIVPILPVVQRTESWRCTIALVIAAEVYWERANTKSVLNNCESNNLACKNGMEEFRPDCEYSSGSLEELIWLAKMGWRNFVLNYKYINYYGESRQEIPPADVLHSR